MYFPHIAWLPIVLQRMSNSSFPFLPSNKQVATCLMARLSDIYQFYRFPPKAELHTETELRCSFLLCSNLDLAISVENFLINIPSQGQNPGTVLHHIGVWYNHDLLMQAYPVQNPKIFVSQWVPQGLVQSFTILRRHCKLLVSSYVFYVLKLCKRSKIVSSSSVFLRSPISLQWLQRWVVTSCWKPKMIQPPHLMTVSYPLLSLMYISIYLAYYCIETWAHLH